ncbi:ABC-2 type transporter-domain-containing protein [Suillus lakei]|nr:ABC-2 type transporter-domain-containing protein [Suillus lakei]
MLLAVQNHAFYLSSVLLVLIGLSTTSPSNASSCLVLLGFGGATCAQPACDGTYIRWFESDCTCESGWGGVGCNVCTTSSACQVAYTASQWQCNCQVNNPTLEALYPLRSTLNILPERYYRPSTSSSIYAQLIYAGVEQFFCTASPCTQTLSNSITSSGNTTLNTWTCQNLSCNCIQNATFCGGVPVSNLTSTISGLTGTLIVACDSTNTCHFQQETINSVFGSQGLSMEGCVFGECVTQAVIDTTNATSSAAAASGGTELSGGVVAGLAVVGTIILFGLVVVAWGWYVQRAAKKLPFNGGQSGGISVRWSDISYVVHSPKNSLSSLISKPTIRGGKTILDSVSGSIESGQLMAILGPSGAGKTTLVELIAGKTKSGQYTGSITFPPYAPGYHPRIAFVPQSDILPSMLTVREALTFAASLRLPESLPTSSKAALVSTVISKLGLDGVAETRIGATDGTGRGISGGEARRVSIGLELVGCPDVLTSVSAFRVVNVLKELAREGGVAIGHQGSHGHRKGVAVICSVHQPSSRLYHTFDSVHLLSNGRALGGAGTDVLPYEEGYNVADYLLDIASEPPDIPNMPLGNNAVGEIGTSVSSEEKADGRKDVEALLPTQNLVQGMYAATFLTQLQVLCGREWKVLRRDKTLFFTHMCVACVLGIFCGGLYYQTGSTIAGFQARVGCLFFMGSLIAFSSLSALYNIVEIRPLFLRERSNWYYSPTAWLLSRLIFDVIPLRIMPTIILCTITYWMAGLAHDAVHFFKFLLIIVLYTLVMTLYNFLLGTLFRNGGIAILLSALSALYQMTYAGFFVHLASIPPVLRWLQWLCPLNYTLEAISVNEVGSGLMISDTLQGVPVNISATLIMQLLFGFGLNNYYRDVLVLFAFIAGLGVAVIAVVWLKVRERR